MSAALNPTAFDTYFLLPFVFGPARPEDADARFAVTRKDQKAALHRLVAALTGPTTTPLAHTVRWERVDTAQLRDSSVHYSERQYLHPFALRVLDEQTLLRPAATPWGVAPGAGQDLDWPLSVTLSNGSVLAGLTLKNLTIHLFDIGVGFLSIETSGRLPNFRSMLAFNEEFRWTGRDYADRGLPRVIEINGTSLVPFDPFTEEGQRGLVPQSAQALRVNRFVAALLGDRVPPGIRLEPILDWRMVVLNWAASQWRVGDREWWGHLYVDTRMKGPSFNPIRNDGFQEDLLKKSEYRRWWAEHRIGFSRYSGVFNGVADDWFFNNIIRRHVGTVYYALTLLTYLHRAKIIELQRESAALAQSIGNPKRASQLADRLRLLREDFMLFSTHYWFVELTHQDQGIDMSQKWAEVMGNRALFNELREEIERFEAYQSQRAAERTGQSVTRLTIALSIVAAGTGLLGANFLPGVDWGNANPGLMCALLTVVAFAGVGPAAWLFTRLPDWWRDRKGR